MESQHNPPAERARHRLADPWTIPAVIIGNAFEWFDFTAFGFFAVYIAKAFFPADSEIVSLLRTLATFGVGFVARPIGAAMLGYYADRSGRKAALTLIIAMTVVGTATIAFLPPYSRIGWIAPFLLVVARLVQGFSVGGELGSATAFFIESAPPGRRTLYASFQMAGQFAATLIGVITGSILTHELSPSQLDEWGWRLPFILGLLIGPLGVYIRFRTTDPLEYLETRKTDRRPIGELVRSHGGQIATVFGLTILGTAFSYVLVVYMPTYAIKTLGVSPFGSFAAVVIGTSAGLVACIASGALCDAIGRIRMMVAAATAIGILVFPLLMFVRAFPTLMSLASVNGILSISMAAYSVPSIALAAELFPVRARSTGLSVGYSLAVALFGGFAPSIVSWLIEKTGNPLAPAFYVIAAAMVSLATIVILNTRRRDSI